MQRALLPRPLGQRHLPTMPRLLRCAGTTLASTTLAALASAAPPSAALASAAPPSAALAPRRPAPQPQLHELRPQVARTHGRHSRLWQGAVRRGQARGRALVRVRHRQRRRRRRVLRRELRRVRRVPSPGRRCLPAALLREQHTGAARAVPLAVRGGLCRHPLSSPAAAFASAAAAALCSVTATATATVTASAPATVTVTASAPATVTVTVTGPARAFLAAAALTAALTAASVSTAAVAAVLSLGRRHAEWRRRRAVHVWGGVGGGSGLGGQEGLPAW